MHINDLDVMGQTGLYLNVPHVMYTGNRTENVNVDHPVPTLFDFDSSDSLNAHKVIDPENVERVSGKSNMCSG